MFSVVLPAFNAEKTIEKSISSVINQTKNELIKEIIVVDDGSIDNTKLIVQKMISDVDKRIKYYYQDNLGVSSARNKGINLAKSEWIALIDSDDIWLPNKIEEQFKIIKDNPKICFLGSHFPIKRFFKKRNGLVKLSAKDLCIRSMPYTPSVIFKKSVGLKYGLFNEKMKYNEDANFYQKFLLEDSYYILSKKLVEIDIGKSYFAESGLSSNLIEMYKGKIYNMKELFSYGLISKSFLLLMILFCYIKMIIKLIQRELKKYKGDKKWMK